MVDATSVDPGAMDGSALDGSAMDGSATDTAAVIDPAVPAGGPAAREAGTPGRVDPTQEPPHPGPRIAADAPRDGAPAAHPVPSPAPPHPAGTPGPAAHPGRPPGERRGSEPGARRGRPSPESAERSLRSLVTTRSTQVSPTAAMRAREVALPDADDLAAAEADLVIVRRHYVPPTSLAAGRRPDRRGQSGGGPAGRG